MCLRRLLKIFFILFLIELQSVYCVHCGKFGFICIDNWSYRKCNVYKRAFVDNFINVCPEHTFCNEKYKRACGKSTDSQDNEIKDIMQTPFPSKSQNTPTASFTKTTTNTTTAPTCPEKSNQKIKSPPSPIKAEKSALGKHGKCKSNSNKNKSKNKHSRHIDDLDEPKILKSQFVCPSVGSFPIKSDDTSFYVCVNRRRSTDNDLQVIKVCCPKSMYFNKMTHRCESRIERSKRNIYWKRSRLRHLHY